MAEPVTLTNVEVQALHAFLQMLIGREVVSVFASDGSDDIRDATTSALVKICKACGRPVPDNLQ
jgi:hypothetical protein